MRLTHIAMRNFFFSFSNYKIHNMVLLFSISNKGGAPPGRNTGEGVRPGALPPAVTALNLLVLIKYIIFEQLDVNIFSMVLECVEEQKTVESRRKTIHCSFFNFVKKILFKNKQRHHSWRIWRPLFYKQ